MYVVLSSLLDDSHSALTQSLESIPSVTVAVVCLEYEGSDAVPSDYRTVSLQGFFQDLALSFLA